MPGWAGDGGEPPPAPAADPVLVLGEGVVRLLRAIAGDRGCLVRLEDLHWADADSMALLTYVASALGSCSVAVTASARDEPAHPAAQPLAASPDVGVAAAGAPRRGAGRRARDRAATGRTAARRPAAPAGRAPTACRLLVEELVDGLARGPGAGDGLPMPPMPPTLAALVARRLAALAPAQVRVVQAAAVLADVADWTALSAVTGQGEQEVLDALRAAARVHLLTVDGAGRLRVAPRADA